MPAVDPFPDETFQVSIDEPRFETCRCADSPADRVACAPWQVTHFAVYTVARTIIAAALWRVVRRDRTLRRGTVKPIVQQDHSTNHGRTALRHRIAFLHVPPLGAASPEDLGEPADKARGEADSSTAPPPG